MSNKATIPVINVSDKIVDEENRPTQLFFMFLHTIIEILKIKVDEAPDDGKLYGRRGKEWVEIV